MRSLRILLLSVTLSLGFSAFAATSQPDSTKLAALSAKLDEYFTALKGESVGVQSKEMDFIIDACKDSLVRQYVAIKIYDHYITSKVMGEEGVAVYLTDNWFVPGKVKMKNDIDLMNARIFADFNRQSLIGCKAPELKVQNLKGDSLHIFANPSGRYTLLYFYAVDCSKCKLETPLLGQVLSKDDFPMDVYAFYTGDNKQAWGKYVGEHFSFNTENTVLNNVWDASFDSDFQRKYGVLQTPRMFLVDPDGVIIGRGLDSEAMEMLMKSRIRTTYEYGNDESKSAFDKIVQTYGSDITPANLLEIADYMSNRAKSSGQPDSYKQLMGDYFYWMAEKPGEAYKIALDTLISRYILNGAFNTPEDSLQVVNFALITKDILSRTAVGTRIPDLKVSALLASYKNVKTIMSAAVPDFSKAKLYSLRKLRNSPTYIFFYSESCNICKHQLSAVDSVLTMNHKAKVLLVDLDQLIVDDNAQAQRLMDSFDLSRLPFIISMDKKGIVKRKYISLISSR
jgi:thiol-disulfide isomerase/thioredoxin